jgi:hypothetical protein
MSARSRRRLASPGLLFAHLLTLFALALALVPPATPALAEGSRDMLADNTNGEGYRAHLEFHVDATSADIPRQTTIKAFARAGETIYLGSSAMGLGRGDVIIRGPSDTTPAQLWVRGPSGQPGGPGDPNTRRCSTRTGGVANYGRILNLAQELAGPQPATGGFTPCVVSAAETTAAGDGIWEFDFISPNPEAPLPLPSNPTPIKVDLEWAGRSADASGHWINAWDVSVRTIDATQDVEIPGRVFAN